MANQQTMAAARKHSSLFILLLILCAIESSSLGEAAVVTALTSEDGVVAPEDGSGTEPIIGDTTSHDDDDVIDELHANIDSNQNHSLPDSKIIHASQSNDRASCNNNDNNNTATKNEPHLTHTPPTHFKISAHIQTDLHTGYSYFIPQDQLPSSFAHLPFLDCGAQGVTSEGVPLVSGVFRHVPKVVNVPKERDVELNLVDALEGAKTDEIDESISDSEQNIGLQDEKLMTDIGPSDEVIINTQGEKEEERPNRPAPPRYVVALSPLEITVGGNGNETQKFNPGDVIFMEDTWWGVWNDFNDETDESGSNGEVVTKQYKMKGYAMKASSDTNSDSNVLMLTVPPEIHRHWKNIQLAMETAKLEEEKSKSKSSSKPKPQATKDNNDDDEHYYRQPWWKLPTRLLRKNDISTHSNSMLPPPCSLESDPAFSHPAASSTSLIQHFNQHFTQLLKSVIHSNPHPSFLPHHHQDLLFPVLAQTLAAAVGGATSFALVIQLSRMVSVGTAVGFGGVCLIGLGTWGFVWLGEEILDELELWKERRRLEKRMSEGWGRGGGSGGSSGSSSGSGSGTRKRRMMTNEGEGDENSQ